MASFRSHVQFWPTWPRGVAGSVDTGRGPRGGVLLSHEKSASSASCGLPVSTGCALGHRVRFLGLGLGGVCFPGLIKKSVSSTTRLEWGWLGQASVMGACLDPVLSRLDSLQLSFLVLSSPDSRTGQGMVLLR